MADQEFKQIQAYLVLLWFALLRIPRFLQIEGLWQPCVEQVYQWHFSSSIFSLCVAVSHFGNSHSISNFFVIFIMVICVVIFDVTIVTVLGCHEARPCKMVNLISEFCSTNQLFPHLSSSPRVSLFPETQ